MSSHMLRLVGKVGRHQNANLPRSVLQYAVASTDLSQRIHIAATHRRAITTSTKKNMSTIPSSYPIVEIEHQHQNTCTSTAPLSEVDFTDATSAHGSKSTFEILRAIAVFNACQFPWLVKHAEGLLGLSTKLLGSTITNTVVKQTFFKHFCAGEDSFDMKPVIDKLQQSNIGPIREYFLCFVLESIYICTLSNLTKKLTWSSHIQLTMLLRVRAVKMLWHQVVVKVRLACLGCFMNQNVHMMCSHEVLSFNCSRDLHTAPIQPTC